MSRISTELSFREGQDAYGGITPSISLLSTMPCRLGLGAGGCRLFGQRNDMEMHPFIDAEIDEPVTHQI